MDCSTSFSKTTTLLSASLFMLGMSQLGLANDEYYVYDQSGNISAKRVSSEEAIMSFDSDNRMLSFERNGDRENQVHSGSVTTVVSEDGSVRETLFNHRNRVGAVVEDSVATEVIYNWRGMPVAKRKDGSVEGWAWDGIHMCVVEGEARQLQLEVVDILGNSLEAESSLFGEGSERFTGRFFDEDLQAFVFPFRLYSSKSSRWMESDPIGYPDGPNRYAYLAEPTSQLDVLGLAVESGIPAYSPNEKAFYGTLGGTRYGTQWSTTSAGGPKVKQAGSVGATSGSPEGGCYQSEFVTDIEYDGNTDVTIKKANLSSTHTQGSQTGYIDATTVTHTKTHEEWHHDIYEALLINSYGKLEAWSKSYKSDDFDTQGQANTAAGTDRDNNTGLADTAYSTNWGNRNDGHTGPTVQQVTVGGNTYDAWRATDGGNWGQGALNHMNGITEPTWTKEPGNCEAQ